MAARVKVPTRIKFNLPSRVIQSLERRGTWQLELAQLYNMFNSFILKDLVLKGLIFMVI